MFEETRVSLDHPGKGLWVIVFWSVGDEVRERWYHPLHREVLFLRIAEQIEKHGDEDSLEKFKKPVTRAQMFCCSVLTDKVEQQSPPT